MTKFQLVGAIFLFVIGIYALVLGIKFLLSRGSKSEADIVKQSKAQSYIMIPLAHKNEHFGCLVLLNTSFS